MATVTAAATLGLTLDVNASGSTLLDIGFDITNDLDIVDNLETVTFRNRGAPSESDAGHVSYPNLVDYPCPGVKRTRVTIREAETSNGKLRASDIRFRVKQALLATAPGEQWEVVATDGTWHVVMTDVLGHASQYRVYCRR